MEKHLFIIYLKKGIQLQRVCAVSLEYMEKLFLPWKNVSHIVDMGIFRENE